MTRELPQRLRQTAESLCMPPVTAREIASLITESVVASLQIALERGCTAADAADIAKAIGNNAGMTVYMEVAERGLETEDA